MVPCKAPRMKQIRYHHMKLRGPGTDTEPWDFNSSFFRCHSFPSQDPTIISWTLTQARHLFRWIARSKRVSIIPQTAHRHALWKLRRLQVLQFLFNRNEKCMQRSVCILEQKHRTTRLNPCAVALQVLPNSRGEACKVKVTQPSILGQFASHYISIRALNCFKKKKKKAASSTRCIQKAASSTRCIDARKHNLLEDKVQRPSVKPLGLTRSTALPSLPLPAALPSCRPAQRVASPAAGAGRGDHPAAPVVYPGPGRAVPGERAAPEPEQCPASRGCRSAGGEAGDGRLLRLPEGFCAEGKPSRLQGTLIPPRGGREKPRSP